MAFYLESQYLDLKKVYQNFSYESLETKIDIQPTDTISDGITQNTYTLIQEKDLLYSDVANLLIYFEKFHLNNPGSQPDKGFPFIKIKERICYIMQKYQEQSNLLDPHLEKIVSPLMQVIKQYLHEKLALFLKESAQNNEFRASSMAFCDEFHHFLSMIYVICKIRGFKFVMKYFPHEVKDLEPCVFYLSSQRDVQSELWETKYVMFLWLSIIILVPFDLSTIDSKAFGFSEKPQGQGNVATLTQTLIYISQFYLKSITKIREAAGIFLASFFKRPDVQKMQLLEDFLKWAGEMVQNLHKDPLNGFFITGIHNALVEIFKIGQRDELIGKIPLVMPFMNSANFGAKTNESSVLRQAKVKLAQRIGLIYLRPRQIKWLYRMGNKSLLENLKKSKEHGSKLQVFNVEAALPKLEIHAGSKKQEEEEPESEDYFEGVDTENLEFLIDYLVQGLKDKDTIVRWSAAKGLGRITSRLDHEMADDIVNSILSCFAPNENENSWHGGCLTIAELSRRGLLLPSRLDDVIPILSKALVYDQNQGSYSVGANVRDAACYVAWAFARAYSPEILKKHVTALSQSLLITCLFDREVNCRRAASAAFQEHVGRQGNFPHGIEILTEADYFTLGMRQNAFLNVGLFVGSYSEYYEGFVQHLAFVKLKHWDPEIRRLSASALALYSVLGGKNLWNAVLKGLVKESLSEMVHMRHGALYGLSDILCGLRGRSHLHNMKHEMKDSEFLRSLSKKQRKLLKAGEYMQKFKVFFEAKSLENQLGMIDGDIMAEILDVLPRIDKARLFRGKGGEIMRVAACRLIEGISIAEIKLSEPLQKKYLEIIDDCLKNPLELIQSSAVKALKLFSAFYHHESVTKDVDAYLQKLIKLASDDPIVAVTRGYSRALGALSARIQTVNFENIWKTLKRNCEIKPKEIDDPDTRKFALKSLKEMIANIGLTGIKDAVIEDIFEVCFRLMGDYTTDKRGDIGSMIRETSMTMMLELFLLMVSFNEKSEPKREIRPQLTYTFVALLLQQLVEKIDRTRLVAGSLLQDYFEKAAERLPLVPRHKELNAIFSRENVNLMLRKDEIRMEEIFETKILASSAFEGPEYERQQEFEEYVYYWNQPHCVFPMVVPLIRFKEYSYYIMKGLVISIGGITESLIKHSLSGLKAFLVDMSKDPQIYDEVMEDICGNFLKLVKENISDERVIAPLYKALDFLLEAEEFTRWKKGVPAFADSLFPLISQDISASKSITKLMAAAGLAVGLFTYVSKENKKNGFQTLIKLMTHKFAKLRKIVADKLYMYFLADGDLMFGEAKNEEICDILVVTNWNELSPAEIKSTRAQLESYASLF